MTLFLNARHRRFARMNWWLLNVVIILQLHFCQVLTDLACFKTDKCTCRKHIDKEEIEVTCNSLTVKANLMDSFVATYCSSEQIQWEQHFDQINVTKFLSYDCSFSTGIHHSISTLGVNNVEEIKFIRIKLDGGSLEKNYLSSLKNVRQLDISDTKPMLKLTNESFEGTPNLKRLFLRGNSIKELPKDVFKNLIHLEILDLGNNEISTIDNELFNGISLKGLVIDSNYLTTVNLNVPSLKHLDVSNNKLISVNVGNLYNLLDISLNKNTLVTMPDQPFENTSLVMIKFNYGSLTTLPKQFLFGLGQLQKVYLKSFNIEVVPENMIWNTYNITELVLASNRLKEIPVQFFRDSGSIKILDLSRNLLEQIDHDLLRPLTKLERLDLSQNLLIQINHYGFRSLQNLVSLNLEKNNIIHIEREALNVPKLKYLKLAHNKISKLKMNYSFMFHYLEDIEDVDLTSNSITDIDNDWVNLVRLKQVNLANNNFKILRLENIQFFNEGVEIILNSNPLEVIDSSGLEIFVAAQPSKSSADYENSGKRASRKISFSGNKLICDCHNYYFAKYVQKQMPTVVYDYLEIKQNFTCADGKIFKNVNLDSITCDWDLLEDENKIDCPDCVCTYRPHDKSAVMNCSNSNLKLPPTKIISSKNTNYTDVILRNNSILELPNYEFYNIRKLDASYNQLSNINITQLPKNLVELNLEHNNLVEINDNNLDSILRNLSLIRMSGNPWKCDSDAKNTYNFINHFSQKIVNLNNLMCSDSTQLINKIMENKENREFQKFKHIVGAVSLTVFILLLILLWALFNGYKTEIKVWLYSHNITWPITEESLDQNKKYDAFISFSHKDLDFIEDELVPGLEGGNNPFKLCLHYRDWAIGEYIPYQIARSVDESRRTVIVLSQNFLESIWAGTEFRTAYISALNERRTRIIVILYGKVSTDSLDPDLKEYLSMNTYIEWGDRWFWKKLRYALPHRKEKKIRTEPIVPDKLNPLVLKVT